MGLIQSTMVIMVRKYPSNLMCRNELFTPEKRRCVQAARETGASAVNSRLHSCTLIKPEFKFRLPQALVKQFVLMFLNPAEVPNLLQLVSLSPVSPSPVSLFPDALALVVLSPVALVLAAPACKTKKHICQQHRRGNLQKRGIKGQKHTEDSWQGCHHEENLDTKKFCFHFFNSISIMSFNNPRCVRFTLMNQSN